MLKYQTQIKKVLGNKCVVCQTEQTLLFHEVNGNSHDLNTKNRLYSYILSHLNDFVPICRKHHLLLHHLARSLKSASEQEKFVELLKKLA